MPEQISTWLALGAIAPLATVVTVLWKALMQARDREVAAYQKTLPLLERISRWQDRHNGGSGGGSAASSD